MAEISNLDPSTINDIKEFGEMARQELKISSSSSPLGVVEKIEAYVKGIKNRGETLQEDLIIGIGALLGDQYVKAFSWHWGEVVWNGDHANSQTCVLPSDNSLSINPIGWVHDVISTERNTNFLLGFNMIAAGNYPQLPPNQAQGIN